MDRFNALGTQSSLLAGFIITTVRVLHVHTPAQQPPHPAPISHATDTGTECFIPHCAAPVSAARSPNAFVHFTLTRVAPLPCVPPRHSPSLHHRSSPPSTLPALTQSRECGRRSGHRAPSPSPAPCTASSTPPSRLCGDRACHCGVPKDRYRRRTGG